MELDGSSVICWEIKCRVQWKQNEYQQTLGVLRYAAAAHSERMLYLCAINRDREENNIKTICYIESVCECGEAKFCICQLNSLGAIPIFPKLEQKFYVSAKGRS